MRSILGMLAWLICAAAVAPAGDNLDWLNDYNVIWDSQSANSAESMPCGGGDIGLNVWVENGDVLLYMQRSGCFNENNEYHKLGRLRLKLDPSPLGKGALFRQELKLREGHVRVTGRNGSLKVSLDVWVEVHRPVVHVDIESNRSVAVEAAYEGWRNQDRELPGGGKQSRFGCFSWDRYAGRVIQYRDVVGYQGNGVLFYHRNRDDRLLFDFMVQQQGLDSVKESMVDTMKGRTFGGLMTGPGFADAGVSTGKYQTAPFQAWKLRSQEPSRSHRLRIVTHIDQSETLDTWMQTLQDRADASANDLEEARKKSLVWWAEFWDRSWIIVKPDETNTIDRAWRTGRNYNLFRYQLGCNVHGEYPSKFNGGNFPKNMVQSWHQDGIFYARMGMTEAAAKYTTSKLHDSPRRFPTFWGPGHDWVPDHNWGGSGMIALQEMLMQTIGNEIRLLPAWPRDWDVKFKLHAPQRTTVECEYRDGEIVELKVTPSQRRKDVIITEEMD